jgi:hypothetical protein
VPIVVVFTQFDKLLNSIRLSLHGNTPKEQIDELCAKNADEKFKEVCIRPLEQINDKFKKLGIQPLERVNSELCFARSSGPLSFQM